MTAKIMEQCRLLIELIKIKITFLVAISSAAGYILASGKLDSRILIPFLGILLLSGGSAALNELQEIDIDLRMRRTKNRPLPANRIARHTALAVIVLLLIGGSSILYFGSGLQSLLLGLLAMFWYNGVYTPMKKRTAFAAIPGAVIGAIPPMVGWVTGGGNVNDVQILLIALFFFIWQIPHFWLLILNSEDDYRSAGLPIITDIFSHAQIIRLTFIWMLTASVTCLMILNFLNIHFLGIKICILGSALLLIWTSFKILMSRESKQIYRVVFVETNIVVLFILVFLSIDKLIHFI